MAVSKLIKVDNEFYIYLWTQPDTPSASEFGDGSMAAQNIRGLRRNINGVLYYYAKIEPEEVDKQEVVVL